MTATILPIETDWLSGSMFPPPKMPVAWSAFLAVQWVFIKRPAA